jgi:hypothetical protein
MSSARFLISSRDHHIDPIDAREVDPADPVQFPTQIELRRIPAGLNSA